MAHAISGFAGRFDTLAASAALGGRSVARLGAGWGFLPVGPSGIAADAPEFRHLTPNLAAWAARASVRAPLVYLETAYSGGVGTQAAAAWVGGTLVARAVTPPDAVVERRDRAINAAARLAGVVPDDEDGDEFDALDLGRYRTNDDWADEAAWVALVARAAAEALPEAVTPAPDQPGPVATDTPDLRRTVWAGAWVACVMVGGLLIGAGVKRGPTPDPPALKFPDLSARLVPPPDEVRAEMFKHIAQSRAASDGLELKQLVAWYRVADRPVGECVPVGRFVVRK